MSQSEHPLTLSTAFYLLPGKISLFLIGTYEVSAFIRGGGYDLLHKPYHEEVHAAR